MAELSRSAFECFQKKQLCPAAILLTRAAVETTSALWYLLSKVESSLQKESVADIDNSLIELNLGSKKQPRVPSSLQCAYFH